MRRISLTVLVVLVTALAGYAQTCMTTTLNNYLGAGFQCTINDQTYSAWDYSSESNPSGFSVAATSVTAQPITTPGNPGFQFTASGWEAGTGLGVLSVDSTFSWTVNSVSPITDLSLSIAGVGFTGTGAVNLDETACLGAILPQCTGGTIVNLSVCYSATCDQTYDQVNFSGVTEVSVEKDLEVASGTNGSAEVSIITDQFSESTTTVPEPSSFLLLGSGILGLGALARRKLNL